jgi:serine/threonine-protein kinase
MGQLYLAKMRGIEGFERLVVLKRLRPDVAQREDNVRGFLDEVRVLAAVQHSNVVHIYDVGTSKDGSYYYTMEFLVGQDLRKLLHRSIKAGLPLPMPTAVHVASAVLAGLHHVHERKAADGSALSIVHRDVSPANIFITYEGDVKLIDFGIAKTARKTTQTEEGVVKGKFRYMSPEQCRTDPVDRRSDIFSLGVVLWEATTGRALYKSDNDIKTLFSIVEMDAPRPSTVVPDYPPALEAIVMKALARDVSERWQSARDMQQALEAFALDARWPQTASALSSVMHERFGQELADIEAAQRAGADLADVVVKQMLEDGSASGSSSGTPSSASLPAMNLLKHTPQYVPMPTVPAPAAPAPRPSAPGLTTATEAARRLGMTPIPSNATPVPRDPVSRNSGLIFPPSGFVPTPAQAVVPLPPPPVVLAPLAVHEAPTVALPHAPHEQPRSGRAVATVAFAMVVAGLLGGGVYLFSHTHVDVPDTSPPPRPLAHVVPAEPAHPVDANPSDAPSDAAQPVAAQPVVAQPVVAQPVAAQPVVAQPVVAQPVVAQPVVAQPTPTPKPKPVVQHKPAATPNPATPTPAWDPDSPLPPSQ